MLPPSVLIVEDDPLTQRALEHLLSPYVARGVIEVRYATSADDAQLLMTAQPAQLVVCDLYLPKKDGLKLGEELKKRGSSRLFLMGAGHVDQGVRERAKRLDAQVFVKPLELPELIAAVVGAAEIGSTQRAPTSGLPEVGSLAERSPGRLLLELWEERRSGELVLVRGRIHKQVTVRRGAPVAVASNLRSETLGHFLVQRGRITDAQHQQAVTQAQRDNVLVGRTLVKLGILQDAELLDELAAQLRSKIVSVLRWPDGEYRFEPGEPVGDRLELPFETPRLVFSGLRRTARLDEIVPRMRAEPARFSLGMRAERHRAVFVRLFGPDGIALFDQRPLVAELVAHRDAASLLVQADVLLRSGCAELEPLGPGAEATPARDPLGLVELGRDRSATKAPAPRSTNEGLFADPETVVRDPSPPVDEAEHEDESGVFDLPSNPDALSAVDLGALDPNGESLRREILAEYLSLHAKDHYRLLAIDRGAAAQDIALAHAAFTRRFRLERFDQVELGRDYARLEEIVARAREAHDTLSNPERRAEYDRALASSPSTSPRNDDRLSAEVYSHEGQARLSRGDYMGARQRLAQAVETDSEQPDYHALLGWATYLTALGPGRDSASQERIRAAAILSRPHLETALSIDPDHTDAHEYLGRIDAAQGDDAPAIEHLEIVLDHSPTRPEALTALEAALARSGGWRRLEQLYRRLIHRLADDPTERPLLVWWRLAELYRVRLLDVEAAKVAYETVARLAPDDPRPRLALAELLDRDVEGSGKKTTALREAWQLQPDDPAPGLALFHSLLEAQRWDAALVAAMALAGRGGADDTSSAFLRTHRPRFLVRAQNPVTPVLFATLRHKNEDAALLAVLAEVFAVSAPEVELPSLGVGPEQEQPAATLPDGLARALAYVSHTLAVPTPTVYVRHDFGPEIHVGATRPSVLLVGPQALTGTDVHVLVFRLARALSYLWPARALTAALPTDAIKEHLGAAMTLAQPGTRFDDPEGRVAQLRARLSGRATSLARTVRPLLDALLSDRRERIHLGRIVAGMARSADRVGLLLCNDLPTAARIVHDECAPGAEDELVDFALGDAFLAAREQLGLAIAV